MGTACDRAAFLYLGLQYLTGCHLMSRPPPKCISLSQTNLAGTEASQRGCLYCRLAATEATCNNYRTSDLRGTKPAPKGTTIPGQCTREVGQLGGLDGSIIKQNMPQNKTLVSLMKIKLTYAH